MRGAQAKFGRFSAAGKGATLQHPGWGGADVGFAPFPVDRVSG